MTRLAMARLNPTLLRVHALLAVGCSSLLIIVWALTTRDDFWPANAMLALALLAIHGWAVLEAARPSIRHRLGRSRPQHGDLDRSRPSGADLDVPVTS